MNGSIVMRTRENRRGIATWIWLVAVAAVVTMTAGLWYAIDRGEQRRLARDTRLVVRIPVAVIDRLTADEIRQQFPIQESFESFEVSGTANARGRVSLEVQPHNGLSGKDVVVHVKVTGKTDNELVGKQKAVQIIGDGEGTFRAVKPIFFDGQKFHLSQATQVEATHETEVHRLEDHAGNPLEGATKFITSRKVNQSLPLLNEAAKVRIESKVREMVDQAVAEAVTKLNKVERMDESLQKLHPKMENWRIAVAATGDVIQAALVPVGGVSPELPEAHPTTLEVWMRLTHSQRAGVRVLGEWRFANRLFRRFVPPDRAEKMLDDVKVTNVDGWTRLRVGLRESAADRA